MQPGIFEYKEAAKPQLEKNHALIRIRKIGICGTDLHAYEGTQPYFNYPRILGHELAGEVVDVNSSKGSGFRQNESVTILPYFSCGTCVACREGKTNCCSSLKVAGVHTDGGMTDYFQVPVEMLIPGAGLDLDSLALVEPLAIGAHSIRRSGVRAGEFALVIGAGPIGTGVMQFAKIAGANVIAMDVNPARLNFSTKLLDIQYAINPSENGVMEKLMEITRGEMPTLVIDATGNQRAINSALQYVAFGGRYVLVGLQKNDLVFSHPEFHKRETTLMSSRNATRDDFEQVINTIKRGLVNPHAYITHRVDFEKLKEQFPGFLNPANEVVKALVEM
jgi:2-desacetyl-2-hydroxyethyl bacteriochlorophyllide A dehydrogenase